MSELVLEDAKSPKRTGGLLASLATINEMKTLQEEIDGYFQEMLRFVDMEPDEIFMRLSAFSARASFIRSQIMRTQNRALTAFRTGEIDPFLTECDRQFKIWSRVFAVTSLDWNLARGQT